jgi:tight adherence protein B
MSAAVQGSLAGVLLGLAAAAAASAARSSRAARVLSRLDGAATGRGLPPAPRRGGLRLPEPPAWLAGRVLDAFPSAPPATVAAGWLAGTGAGAATGLVVGGVGLAGLAMALAVAGAALALALRRGTADRLVEAALPGALEAVARSLRSGAGQHQAVVESAGGATGPLGAELATVARGLTGGAVLEQALGDLERRRPLPGVRLAVAALLLGAEAGGAHARALDGVAASVRSRLAVSQEVRALSSQTRLSAVVIAAAPVAFAALATGTDAASATFLLRTPLGLACLAVGLALDGVGAWWMHRLSQVDA